MKRKTITVILAGVLLLIVALATIPFFAEGGISGRNEGLVPHEMDLSDEGLDFIKAFEGFHRYPEEDYSQWSIGYGGYVCSIDDDPTLYYPDGISMIEAEEMLKNDTVVHVKSVNAFLLEYDIALNQNQFDALISFSYNIGHNVWKRDPSDFTLKRLLIAGNYTDDEITEAFRMWSSAGGKYNAGLYKRRCREAKLFLSEINMSDPAQNGYSVDYYIVNATGLYVRSDADASSERLGSLRDKTVIPVIRYNEDKTWGFTTYAALFGWVSTDYLIPINEKASVITIDENGTDTRGVSYTLDDINMTAAVGFGNGASNRSCYSGADSGYVYLTEYLLSGDNIYTLTSIGDNAFSYNTMLDKMYIPSSVLSIADNAFTGSSLTDIYYEYGSFAMGFAKSSPFTATDYRCVNSHSFGSWVIRTPGSSNERREEICTCAVCLDTKERHVTGIRIDTMPSKLEYIEAEPFIKNGLTVTALYSDGNTFDVTDEATFSGFDSSSLGVKAVTVSYSIYNASFNTKINAKTLVGILIKTKPNVITYVEGTEMITDGLVVVASYDNGTFEPVEGYTLTGYGKNTIGKQTITASYNGFTAAYTVTVRAKELVALSILTNPYKTEYYCGEGFDGSGLSLKASYDNGTSETITGGFTVKNFDSSTEGRVKIRIYYGKLYKSLYVYIILNKLISESYTVSDGAVNDVAPGTTVLSFREAFEASDRITVYSPDGKPMTDDDYIGSGCTAALRYNADLLDMITVSVIGDMNGDGTLSLSDYLIMSRYFTDGGNPITPAYDVNRDGAVSLTDLLCLLASVNGAALEAAS